MSKRDFYLLRHTRVADAQLCYGHHEVALADTFSADAAAARATLPAGLAARVMASPAERCRRLAELLTAAPAFDPRLREMHFGAWEGRPWADIPAAELDPWMADFVAVAPPGGETFGQVQNRAVAVLTELLAAPQAEPIVLVTHAGVIRALLAHALELPLANAFRLNIDYGASARLSWQYGRWQVGWINRTSPAAP